jgi:arylsulfatase A-like enzyme
MRILYLDLDTLRPDHLGCYGYHRNTSPNIDRVASEGIRFENYYCSDAPCLPSRTALMSGRFGIHTGVVNHGGSTADLRVVGPDRGFHDEISTTSLPALLKQAGHHTTFIGGFGERHTTWTFYAGFREIHDTGMNGNESAEDVTPTALDWIERNADKDDWYLHVNYWDAHTPYRAPEEFGNPFEKEPLPGWYSEERIQQDRKKPGPHSAQDIAMYGNSTNPKHPRHPGEVRNMAEMRRLIDGYDCGIAHMDQHIGQLLSALEAKGVTDDLAIIISSDHGENMAELGIYAEHATADHITCRIPMIVRWPGGVRGHVDDGLHYNLDLLPTLADLLDKPRKEVWDGDSYAATVREGAARGRDYLVVSQCVHVCQRGVRWGPWMYVRTYHDGFHLFPQEQLFNIEEDPHEDMNLAETRPEICREATWYLCDWHDRMMATRPKGYPADPLWVTMEEGGPFHAKGELKAYLERLKTSGRGDSVEELVRRHPQEME